MRFDHIDLSVADLEESSRFYCSLLDFQELERKPGPDGQLMRILLQQPDGGMKLELSAAQDGSAPQIAPWTLHLAFACLDYAEKLSLHRAAGCVRMEHPDGTLHFIEDPNGYSLEILAL